MKILKLKRGEHSFSLVKEHVVAFHAIDGDPGTLIFMSGGTYFTTDLSPSEFENLLKSPIIRIKKGAKNG